MSKATRKILAALFGLAIVWVGARLMGKERTRATRLPDGSIARTLGTAVGPTPFSTMRPWQGVARRILPARWQGWLPMVSTMTCGQSSNSVTVYLERTEIPPGGLGSPPWTEPVAADDSGFRYFGQGGLCSSWGTGARELIGITLLSFPRRQPRFDLQLCGHTREVLATLSVANPIRGPFPEWKAESLPITLTNGPLVITLESLTELSSSSLRWVKPTWRIQAADPRWQEAKARLIHFEDPTGNAGPFLSKAEPAWKLKAVAHRVRSSDFDADERLAIANLIPPRDGDFQALDLVAERAGAIIKVGGLGGAGELVITNGTTRVMLPPGPVKQSGWSSGSSGTNRWESWMSERAFFFVEVLGLDEHDEIRFLLATEDGREIPLDEPAGYASRPQGSRIYQRKFTPPPESKRLGLQIILSRARLFEFMINPSDIQPSSKP